MGQYDQLLMIAVVLVAIYLIMKDLGLGDLIVGVRGTRRVRVQDEPRDQAERWLANNRRAAKSGRPSSLKFLAYRGDRDVPPRRVGRTTGLQAHQEGYLVYVREHRWEWAKPYILPRELCSDVNRRTLWVDARGFSTNGLYRFPIPPQDHVLTPDEVVKRSRRLFRLLFGLQVLVDAEEDTAWAQSSALMPSVADRVKAAEVEVPHTVERPYVSEDQVVGR